MAAHRKCGLIWLNGFGAGEAWPFQTQAAAWRFLSFGITSAVDYISITLGILLAIAGVVLEIRNRLPVDGPSEDASSLDQKYLRTRRRSRRLVHILIVLTGLLMACAGSIGPGKAYVLLWTAVILMVFITAMLAYVDAFRTYRYSLDKLPEIRDETLEQDASREGTS